jgi:hypothetical protein
MVPDAEPTSYYGRPVLKEPVWKWPVPAYFATGGLAAASSLLATGARAAGNQGLARRSRLASLGATLLSAAFLIEDLGRPERFVNMLRVVKPTSPMSMGSWLLAAYGPAVGTAAAADVLGMSPALGLAADIGAATLAPAVASYTAVIVADTAVPAWHEARGRLPYVFVSGAAASAGGLACMLTPPATAGPARRLAVAGAVAELVSVRAMERRLGELAEPYHEGRAGRLTRAAATCAALGGATLALWGRRRRPAAVAGGALLLTGAVLERFAVFEAGRQSARDPKYTVGPQRARLA